jgi:hypothetical protein
MVVEKNSEVVEYLPVVTEIFAVTSVITFLSMSIGVYQRTNQPDFDFRLRRAMYIFLRGTAAIIVCLGLLMFIFYSYN